MTRVTNNGTQLQISDCDGSNGQKWSLPYNELGQSFGTPPDPASRMQYCIDGFKQYGLSAWDVLGAQKLYGRKYRGSLVGYRGRCANIKDASTTNGASNIDYPCRNQANDTWFRDPAATNERFKSGSSRCLNVQNGTVPNPVISYTCNGDENERFTTLGVEWHAMGNMCVQGFGLNGVLQLRTCGGVSEGAQKWNFFHPVGGLSKHQIQLSGSNLCVAAQTISSSVPGKLGEALVLKTCSATDARQLFTSTNAGLLALTKNTGLCTSVEKGTTDEGNQIILWNGCSSSPPVNSQFSLGGKIQTLGDCMTSQGADSSQPVTAATCNAGDTTTQVWEYYF